MLNEILIAIMVILSAAWVYCIVGLWQNRLKDEDYPRKKKGES